jgi:hypothetical protein
MAITTLQFLVGVLVTIGGAAFATLASSSFGRSLGLVHLSIGLIALAGGFIALSTKSWSWQFLLVINVLTIAYSSSSEGLVQMDSLLPLFASLASLIGTIIAIIMSGAIISLLAKNQMSSKKSI